MRARNKNAVTGAIWYSFERVRLRRRGKDSCEGEMSCPRLDTYTESLPFSAFCFVSAERKGSQTYRDALFVGTSSGAYSAWGRKAFES